MYCNVRNRSKNIDYVHRLSNGNIRVRTYCIQPKYEGKSKKITHEECGSHEIIYRNGEGYDIGRKILYDDKFKNLIGCWCNDNLKFQTPVEAQNHRLEKHPEEFQE
jgi:hypothetical protein